jgi:hypothetical protein
VTLHANHIVSHGLAALSPTELATVVPSIASAKAHWLSGKPWNGYGSGLQISQMDFLTLTSSPGL